MARTGQAIGVVYIFVHCASWNIPGKFPILKGLIFSYAIWERAAAIFKDLDRRSLLVFEDLDKYHISHEANPSLGDSVNTCVKKSFEFPKAILEMINECSAGGFILFTINDRGAPMIFQTFDNEILAIGLRKFAIDYLANVERVEEDAGCDFLKRALGVEEEDSEEES